LMVHGTCSSAGCYAMTDQGIAELYAVAREAFTGGQRAFQFQAYPFRMTAENMAKYIHDQVKEGLGVRQGVRLSAVKLWETDTASATYRER